MPNRNRFTGPSPLADRFWPKVRKSEGCWLWTGWLDKDGYGQIAIGGAGGRSIRTHRVAWFLIKGYWPAYLCHTCDVRNCVNPAHLFEGNGKINAEDRARKGRSGKSHLRPKQVVEIRRLHSEGITQDELATRFGVEGSVIRNVVRRKTWKHL